MKKKKSSKAFKKIKAGLDDALVFAKGDSSEVRIHTFKSNNLQRAVTLAKALQAIDDAYYEMDAVLFNPSSYLEIREEIKDKICELLVEES